MVAGSEIVLFCQPFLHFFNFRAQYFNNPFALGADQMIVVFMSLFMLKTAEQKCTSVTASLGQNSKLGLLSEEPDNLRQPLDAVIQANGKPLCSEKHEEYSHAIVGDNAIMDKPKLGFGIYNNDGRL